MKVDQVHFVVDDATAWRNWFQSRLGFQAIATRVTLDYRAEVLTHKAIQIVLFSPCRDRGSIAHYAKHHPPGVYNVAFQVNNLDQYLAQAQANGAIVVIPLQYQHVDHRWIRWATIQGWGSLRHTLIERSPMERSPTQQRNDHPLEDAKPAIDQAVPIADQLIIPTNTTSTGSSIEHPAIGLSHIDHLVLNVEAGQLQAALSWYEKTLGFQRQQQFSIRTKQSALKSQVLSHPQGSVQLPINEPVSPNSQIQEFLDHNAGPGIQHIALATADILSTVRHFRQHGISLLSVPSQYYQTVQARSDFDFAISDWDAIAAENILVDWQPNDPQAKLLQTFTKPIFSDPTFFFEIIERRGYYHDQQYRVAEGFGEGNFQALVEAVEREQMQRALRQG